MAPITQISQMRQLRGNKDSVPIKLAEGVICWINTTGELIIGGTDNPTSQTPNPARGRTAWPYENVAVLTEFSRNIEDYLRYRPQLRNSNSLDVYGRAQARLSTQLNGIAGFDRNLQEKLDETISILDYGATVNDNHDIQSGEGWPNTQVDPEQATQNTGAINRAALDVVNIVNGRQQGQDWARSLYFPAGVYFIAKPLLLSAYSRWRGDGAGVTRIVLLDPKEECVVRTVDGAAQSSDLPDSSNPTGGRGALASADIQNGEIVSIRVDNAGVLYLDPQVIISGDGAGASAQAQVIDGRITGITVTNPGTGYTRAEIIIRDNTGDMEAWTYSNITQDQRPQNIHVSGISFERWGTGDVAHIIRGRNITFTDCAFVGQWTPDLESDWTYNQEGNAVGTSVVAPDGSCIVIDGIGNSIIPHNITFERCRISSNTHGCILTSTSNHTRWINCHWQGLFRGLSVGEVLPSTYYPGRFTNGKPRGVMVMANLFENISSHAVITWPRTAVTVPIDDSLDDTSGQVLCVANRYEGCSNGLLPGQSNPYVSETTARVPVVTFSEGSLYNSSISETFSRNNPALGAERRVSVPSQGNTNIVLNAQDSVLIPGGLSENGVVRSGLRTANITHGDTFVNLVPSLDVNFADIDSLRIEYTLHPVSGNSRRTGRLSIVSDGVEISQTDNYDDLDPGTPGRGQLDVELRAVVDLGPPPAFNTLIRLQAKNLTVDGQGIGVDVTMVYTLEAWTSQSIE